MFSSELLSRLLRGSLNVKKFSRFIKGLISPRGQYWERVLHKHKCCDVCRSACAKPFPNTVPMEKLHSLICSNINKKMLDKNLSNCIMHHTAGSDTIFIQIYMDAPPGVPGVSKNSQKYAKA